MEVLEDVDIDNSTSNRINKVFRCRFYSEKLPQIEDAVMVRVTAITDLGAYVELLEYDNMEGMLLLSELSRRRIRSVNKLVRIGRIECVIVTRVDADKKYIDLSKRRATSEEIKACGERYAKAKAVNSILRRVAETLQYSTQEQFEELYEKTAWYFDRKYIKKIGAYSAFRSAAKDPAILDSCDIDEVTREALLQAIKCKLPLILHKLRSTFDVTCFTFEGIDAIKEALMRGMGCSTEDVEVKINLVVPPTFVMNVAVHDFSYGLDIMNLAMKAIEDCITSKNGYFKAITAPKIVTDKDEEEMSNIMEKLRLENAEVSGDSDSSDCGFDFPV